MKMGKRRQHGPEPPLNACRLRRSCAAQTHLRWRNFMASLCLQIYGWENIMEIDTSKGHPDMDYAEHTGTYKGFLRLTQIAVVLLVLLMVGMYVFLV
jgi:hypothetical protein